MTFKSRLEQLAHLIPRAQARLARVRARPANSTLSERVVLAFLCCLIHEFDQLLAQERDAWDGR